MALLLLVYVPVSVHFAPYFDLKWFFFFWLVKLSTSCWLLKGDLMLFETIAESHQCYYPGLIHIGQFDAVQRVDFFLTDGWRHWPVFRLFVGLLNLWFEWNCAFDLSPLWLRHLKSMLVCPYRLCRCYIYQSQAHHDWSCFCFIFDISPAYVSPLLFFFFLRLTSFGCCNACARQLNFLLYPVWCKRCFPVLRRNVVSPFEGHTWAKKSALNNGVSVVLFIGFRLRSWSAMSVASCSSKDFKKPIAANIPALLSTRAANA